MHVRACLCVRACKGLTGMERYEYMLWWVAAPMDTPGVLHIYWLTSGSPRGAPGAGVPAQPDRTYVRVCPCVPLPDPQNYFVQNPGQGYCRAVVGPKVVKFGNRFGHLLK